jgi:murein DD-endopeptidase MepM/ murein hydrolase activator NlpD
MRHSLATLAICLSAALAPPAEAIELELPLACTPGVDCWIVHYVDHEQGPGLADSFCGELTYDGHDGTDFAVASGAAMRAGMPVLAAAEGIVRAKRDGEPDMPVEQRGKGAVAGKDCGNGVILQHEEGWTTQYCHLRQGSIAVREGDTVKAGQRLGLVGNSGMASFPHLHLTLRKDEQKLDPFTGTAPGTGCAASNGRGLWSAAAGSALAYRPIVMPLLGIAEGPVDAEASWDGRAEAARFTSDSAALVAFAGFYGLRAHDRVRITLVQPDGNELLRHEHVQQRDQARTMLFAGERRPAEGWPTGTWTAAVELQREGAPPFRQERQFAVEP